MSYFSGKKALVTGAGSNGIGRAVACAFAEAGVDVAIHHCGQHEQASALAERFTGLGRNCSTHDADLSDPALARATVRDAIRRLDGLDILVNCASVMERKPFMELTDQDWDRTLDLNLRGYFAVAQEAAMQMASNRYGRIIMISALEQQKAGRHLAQFAASQGGVMMLARSMAVELASSGITVNLVAPGTIRTDLNRKDFDNKAFESARRSQIPMQAIGRPSDVAGSVLYLASDAASYVTGTTIHVDGGLAL